MESLSSFAKRFVGAGRQARRRLRVRAVAGHLDRAEDHRQQPALHGRDDDRHRELPEPAVRHDRPAPLPAHGRAHAQPHPEPDPRGDPRAARGRRDRAAGSALQGVRRGSRLRLHRRPQERLPPAGHRRQGPCDLSEDIELDEDARPRHRRRGGPVRRRPAAREGDQGRDRRCAAHRRRASRVHIVKGVGKADSRAVLRRLCSPTHHFVYGDIAARPLHVQQPRERVPDVRRPRRPQAHAPGAAGPRSHAEPCEAALRQRGVQLQPRHLGRPADVQPEQDDAVLPRRARGRTCRRNVRDAF